MRNTLLAHACAKCVFNIIIYIRVNIASSPLDVSLQGSYGLFVKEVRADERDDLFADIFSEIKHGWNEGCTASGLHICEASDSSERQIFGCEGFDRGTITSRPDADDSVGHFTPASNRKRLSLPGISERRINSVACKFNLAVHAHSFTREYMHLVCFHLVLLMSCPGMHLFNILLKMWKRFLVWLPIYVLQSALGSISPPSYFKMSTDTRGD